MCGYCIEGIDTLKFVENENYSVNEKLDNNLLSIYIQESTHFPEIISKLKNFNNFHYTIDVAFYRFWEALLDQENCGIYHCLVNGYGEQEIHDYLSDLKNNPYNESWKSLGNSDLYTNRHFWDNFLKNENQLIEDSESNLKTYLNFWIRGKNRAISDQEKIMDATGTFELIETTNPKDREKFYAMFPVVYFSLLIVKRFKNDSEVLRSIAIENSRDVPSFLGYDLWLQRKAFLACVKNYGINFVLDNYYDIRLELIYYILLKESFCVTELDLLKSHLQSHEHWDHMVDTDSIVKLINKLKSIG